MFTLSARAHYEELIKKSRFIALVAPVSDEVEARGFFDEVRQPKANHHCWAYRIGDVYRSSDDGEPSGTAGRPILAAIDGQELDQIAVVVIRYFGGVKLGAGGLVRAYGGTAAKCLQLAPRREVIPTASYVIRVPFELTGVVYAQLDKLGIEGRAETHDATGAIITVALGDAARDEIEVALRDAGRGRVLFEAVEE